MIYVGYDTDTGRPLGAVFSSNEPSARMNWPGAEVLEFGGDGLPDLTDKWVVDGALVPRGQVTDQAVLEAMAAEKATQARTTTLTELAATDGPLIRVIEDLATTLISKKVITPADLPKTVRDKLAERENLRSILNA